MATKCHLILHRNTGNRFIRTCLEIKGVPSSCPAGEGMCGANSRSPLNSRMAG